MYLAWRSRVYHLFFLTEEAVESDGARVLFIKLSDHVAQLLLVEILRANNVTPNVTPCQCTNTHILNPKR